MPVSDHESLQREIGVRALALAILNVTVGTGIFMIPAIIAENLGASAILAYLVCGALIFLIALCLAELGSNTTRSGGLYTYIENAFGPYIGFLASNIFLFGSSIFSDAAVANGLADMLKAYLPFLNVPMYRSLFFILVFGAIALLNIRSVRYGVTLVALAAYGKLIPLVIIVVAGAGFISPHNLVWESSPTVANIGGASLLLFFAFMGVETPLSNGGEIKNPRRTVPLAVFFGVGGVLALYMSIQLVTQGVLGHTLMAHRNAPLAAVAGLVFGSAGMVILIIISIISMVGNLGGEILSMPRIVFASARDGLMPKFLRRVHPRFATPYAAILAYAAADIVISIAGGFQELAVLASASILISYLGVVLAVVKLRKQRRLNATNGFRVPGGPVIPIIATIGIAWLLSHLSRQELTGISAFIVVLSVVYVFIRMQKGSTTRLHQ